MRRIYVLSQWEEIKNINCTIVQIPVNGAIK
jgi:hypothetical protein